MSDKANISKITLRSGQDYDELIGRTEEKDGEENKPEELIEEVKKHERDDSGEGTNNAVKRLKPYLYRGEAKRQKEDPTDFMEIFGKLEINLPFLQALKLHPFSRFIKDFIAGKAKPDGKIVIGESVFAVIQKRMLPSKRTDPGMFTLPIIIWNVKIEHAMCDMRASINVLPFSVYKRLTEVSLVDIKVVIQLADRSCISHEGVLENVIVRVHDFLYPTDFHVIRMNEFEDGETSGVLLGMSFLRTAKTIIDVSDSTICLDYHGEKFTFNIDKVMKKPMDTENLHSLVVIYPLVQECLETELLQEQLAAAELNDSIEEEVSGWCDTILTQNMTDEEINDAIMRFFQKSTSTGSTGFAQLSSLEKVSDFDELAAKNIEKNPLPQEAVTLKKELKTLSPGLKYAYLRDEETFLVIINSQLTAKQDAELLNVLRRNQKAMDGFCRIWSRSDQTSACITYALKMARKLTENRKGN
ncbi:uncharacterized protein LOC121796707 [Salvia splendens]|uniref:uncharacterized protein LOC121796707 n=1 Tax=Salvia splendens TaxID=180675 RepID=UPI001C26F3DF|nr:uncharacterized protein LOC121796707 [Salvia splendens]